MGEPDELFAIGGDIFKTMRYSKNMTSFFLIDCGNVLGAKASGAFCYSGEKKGEFL